MKSRIPTMMSRCFIAVAVVISLGVATAAEADLPKLVADAAAWQSGQNVEPIQKLEQLLRDANGRPALRAELEATAVKLLAPSATFETRRFACQLLAVVGTDASIPAIAELLANDETAGIACLALTTQRSPKATEALRNALATARGRTRLQILGALGNHRDAQSIEAFVKLACDADAAVADAAILALAKIGTPPAHQAIAALRKESKPAQIPAVTEATLRVAEQLAAAGDREAASALYAELLRPESPTHIRRGALAALLILDKDGGQQRILDTLGGHDKAVTPVAIARVASLKGDGISATFAARLPTMSPAARVWMIEALASRGDAAAYSAVRNELPAADAEVRRSAVAAVGKLGDASAVPLLAKMLAGAKSPRERLDLEHALGSLRGGATTTQAVVEELKRCSGDTKLRLISVLTRRDARVAVPALLAEAGGSDVTAVCAALQALGKIAAAEDLPAILDKLVSLNAPEARADGEHAAARAMAKTADVSRRSEAVRATLKDCGTDARLSLLRLLPGAADANALAALKAATEDQEPRVRDAAVRALTAWPDASAWDAIVAVLGRPENDSHRVLALRALVRLAGDLNAKPDAALVARYRQLLAGARGDDDLKLILSALGGAAHPEALDLALPLLSKAAIRAETEQAVKRIAESVKAQHPQAAQAALERLKQAKP